MNSRKPRVVVLAAGQGTRLRPLTDDRPKCMVEISGHPILAHQLAVFRTAGIEDIHVITGYRADTVNLPGIVRHINPRYATTNMVGTFFSAEHVFTSEADLIISYGDIVYEPRVLQALLTNQAPVALAIDAQWRRFWEARMSNPLADAETLKLRDVNRIIELGKKPKSYEDIQGQYMGLIKIRADHVLQLAPVWRAMDRNATYDGGKSYDNMFMTTFLQHLIDIGWDVRASLVENGWMEVDAPEDLALANSGFWHPTI